MKKKLFYSIVLLLVYIASPGQQKVARLIVRGDDMGFTHAGNEALINVNKKGIETSIEVIVVSPWFPEAVKLLQQNPGVDVGIHLALTSEWENLKWRPLTDCASLTDSNGYFYPMVYPNKNYPGQSIKENHWKLADIEKEFRAQITLAIRKIPRISHISAHMGCADIDKDVKALVKKLVQEYNIDIDPKELGVQSTGYKGPSGTVEEKLKSFLNMLDSFKPGETYLFVDHPALDGPEMRAIYHIGYENVAADRQGVTDVWTNPLVMEAIRKKNIQLISYADLRK
ncbi:MAG: polysaccharide deacetylase family protein [Ferruginibacter sp.]